MIIQTDKTIPEVIQKIVGTNGILNIRWRKKYRRQGT